MSAPRAVLGAGLLALTLAACSSGQRELKTSADLAERCDIARDADFAGDGKWKFDRYLESLVRTSGGPYEIQPREFQLLVSGAPAPVVGGHPVGGEIACSWGKRYIYLYKEALSDRTLAITYNTIAREYFHHVQVRRDGVSCNSSVDGLAALQAEARDWAQKVAPLCQ
jgi:hypothetical protein